MKIWCDFCDKEPASVFCSADEAALCNGCDGRVHHANKLASKHKRFSLLNPSSKESPLCDICQERRALLFCREDRAILCRECDISIHKCNEYTKNHNRYLLTRVKLSDSSSTYPSSSPSDCCGSATTKTTTTAIADNRISHFSAKRTSSSASKEFFNTNSFLTSTTYNSDNGSISTSSISEYLIETLPGWHFEDFLLDPSSAANNFCKTYDHFLPFGDQDLGSDSNSFSSGDFPQRFQIPTFSSGNDFVHGITTDSNSSMIGHKRRENDFAVLPIIPPAAKKTRLLW